MRVPCAGRLRDRVAGAPRHHLVAVVLECAVSKFRSTVLIAPIRATPWRTPTKKFTVLADAYLCQFIDDRTKAGRVGADLRQLPGIHALLDNVDDRSHVVRQAFRLASGRRPL
jgi:hypothetical protein